MTNNTNTVRNPLFILPLGKVPTATTWFHTKCMTSKQHKQFHWIWWMKPMEKLQLLMTYHITYLTIHNFSYQPAHVNSYDLAVVSVLQKISTLIKAILQVLRHNVHWFQYIHIPEVTEIQKINVNKCSPTISLTYTHADIHTCIVNLDIDTIFCAADKLVTQLIVPCIQRGYFLSSTHLPRLVTEVPLQKGQVLRKDVQWCGFLDVHRQWDGFTCLDAFREVIFRTDCSAVEEDWEKGCERGGETETAS